MSIATCIYDLSQLSILSAATCKAQSVRLTLSEGSQEGLVEICQERDRDTFWTGVCEEDMTLAAATVICRQLGFLQANSSGTVSLLIKFLQVMWLYHYVCCDEAHDRFL